MKLNKKLLLSTIKKALILVISILLFNFQIFAQLNQNITPNASKQQISALYYYEQIKQYENLNYLYIGSRTPWTEFPNAIILLLKKNGKVKKAIKLKYQITDTSKWKDKFFFEHIKTPLAINQTAKKSINKYLKQINWKQYYKISDSNFFCSQFDSNNEQYIQKMNDLVYVSDGENRINIIKFNNNIQLINLYMWSNFVSICNMKSHVLLEDFYKKLISLLPK